MADQRAVVNIGLLQQYLGRDCSGNLVCVFNVPRRYIDMLYMEHGRLRYHNQRRGMSGCTCGCTTPSS
jgi:hypothetical protein